MTSQPPDAADHTLAAGTVLLLPAAARLDSAVAVAAGFVIVALAARLSGRLAYRLAHRPATLRSPVFSYVIVLAAVSLATGLFYQALLISAFDLAKRVTLTAGLLILNPVAWWLALGRREGTDAANPPPWHSALLPVATLLIVAVAVHFGDRLMSILSLPAGWLIGAALVLATARAMTRRAAGT